MPDFTSLDRRWKVSTSPTHVFFVGGPFSQWSTSHFIGRLPEALRSDEDSLSRAQISFNRCEQFMMACKAALFRDWGKLDEIIHSDDPAEQKRLGRAVANYDDDAWRAVARDFVTEGNLLKFRTNAKLREYLFATGDKVLVEGAHYDEVWGVKLAWDDPRILDPANWRGTNWLGECLMRVRTILYKELLADIHPGHQR